MAKKKIYRAGLIPYFVKNDKIELLFMRPSDSKFGGEEYQIAKGKIENNDNGEPETNKQAAIREANEELGFTEINLKGPIVELGNFLGRTFIFICEIKDKNFFTKPHFETHSTKWLSPEEFQKTGRNLHKPIVKAAVRKINNLNK